ncbi:MAG: tRNA (guanosine(46)-N7)-methyltransferase TrmB [Tunicatimonas sp.]
MRNKLERFRENNERRNVVEPGKPIIEDIKGNWSAFFGNQHPITYELGCGKGAYTVGLARQYPERNFVGVDVKGARLWVGSTQAEEEALTNVAFLRIRLLDIDRYVAAGEAAELWITFPDPRPRDRDAKRRITSPRFMDLYRHILQPGGTVHLKTDNQPLFDFTLEGLQERNDVLGLEHTHDLYDSPLYGAEQQITTDYEQKFSTQGKKICYLRFRFSEQESRTLF